MHIPDGYLSPATCVVMYGAALPFWWRASQRVKDTLDARMVPLLAIFSAFTFVVQMFNIPVPGGTTAHAVGGTIIAVVLGPWVAIIGVSIALVIQALFFGDGGVLALGANVFNMAIALPLTGYAVYRLASGTSPSDRRRMIAGAIGAYVGINIAGLLTALELGLQPLLFSEGGRALYSPYELAATLPVMMATHLTVAGFAEAAITALVLAYLLRAFPGVMQTQGQSVASVSLGRLGWTMAIALVIIALLTPLGLLAPGGAEFEWGIGEVASQVGFVPAGMEALGDLWQLAPLREYSLPGLGDESGLAGQSAGYVLSAVIGIGLIFIVFFASRVFLARRPQRD